MKQHVTLSTPTEGMMPTLGVCNFIPYNNMTFIILVPVEKLEISQINNLIR